MKQTLAMISIFGALIFGSIGAVVVADFEAGFAAAQKGDYAAALREWTPIAEQGLAAAQSNLGVMYFEGQGVLQDYKTALKWYALAANQGNAPAQYGLGQLYHNGRGVIQDYITAHMWANIAAVNGSEIAPKLRNAIAKEMTPAQIHAAQKRAKDCIAKNYKGC
ncbi:sel1 repeat family protein [Candidatus Puniceispirillum sp.]|nr:sel1 repeat family protein [Candidatus Puniceispirillum sp.]